VRSEPGPEASARIIGRLRLACVALGLALLTFSQGSGSEAPDTKLDLVVSPARFIARALRMWDPTAGAGHMQDQAYGYLFPMGPFFLLGKLAALPPWIVQRSWESLLLIAAFLGVVRLSRLLGVAGFWPRVGAGLAYALAPRMLMELGVISSELLPVTVLPWVLIPLVRGAQEGSPRRGAAKSGVALLFAGGINASATVAILPVPALWLLTRTSGPRRRALMSWWALAVAAACLWWIVPLFVLGRYSPPFLDWIESSQVTTGPTSLIAVLRGADHWEAYLGPSVWPAGWILVAAPAAIVATTAVAALGLTGIAGRATPHRLFLVSCVLVGLVLLTLGHVSSVGPPFAGTMRDLLDGPLNAFRNVHKFDPVLRLPIALGIGHGLAALIRWWPRHIRLRVGRASTTIHGQSVLLVAVLGMAAVTIAPALSGQLVPATRSANDPGWWAQAGSWLGEHEGRGRALVVPGAAQPVYLWGSPRDDALQPYADGPWTVRDAAPLVQPGYVRLLDAIESSLATGADDPTLAPLLARAGIRYLVVRNDLDTGRSDATPLRFVHATIAASPGLRQVATFGPALNVTDDPNRLVDLGLSTTHSAVEVYTNALWADDVSLLPASGVVVANGSADQLGQLVSAGLAPMTPVIFGPVPAAVTSAGVPIRRVATDGIRRREFGFGGIANYSETMSAIQPFSLPRAAHDYLPAHSGPLSTAVYLGIADVRASSSASTPTSFLYRGAAYSPWAALDGDPATAWVSASTDGAVGQWLAVDLRAPVTAPTLRITFAADQSAYPTRVRISTESGSLVFDVAPSAAPQDISLPPGPTQSVRLTVLAMTDQTSRVPVAITSLTIPGITPTRTVRVPTTGAPDELVFATTPGRRSPCLTVSGAATCDSTWGVRGEEDDLLSRTFTLTSAASYSMSAAVRLLPGTRTNALVDGVNPIRAIATSTQATDPRERAGAAVDGDTTTGWVAAPTDKAPTLSLSIPKPSALDGLRLTPAAHAPVTRPTRVLIHAGGVQFDADVSESGVVEFPRPIRTASVRITILKSTLRVSTDSLTGVARLLPVGIGEVTLLGADVPMGQAAQTVTVGCGAGLALRVDANIIALQAAGSAADVLAGRPLAALPCAAPSMPLGTGSHLVTLAANKLAAPQSVTLTKIGSGIVLAGDTSPAGDAEVGGWGSTHRSVHVDTTAPAFLLVRENANAGWQATLNGTALPSVTLDGWQQAWLLPTGARGTVELTFTPQAAVNWGLIAGALAALALLAGALIGGRGDKRAALHDAHLRRGATIALGGVGLLLIGGWAGIALGLVAIGALAVAGRVSRPVPLWLGGALVLAAGLCEASAPAGSADPLAGSAGVQLLSLFGLCLVLAALPRAPSPRFREAVKQRPLEQVPGRGRGRGARERGEHEQLHEVTTERAPAQPPLKRDE
jgi:arabinofuranan 3-O-arabinosyltransferase